MKCLFYFTLRYHTNVYVKEKYKLHPLTLYFHPPNKINPTEAKGLGNPRMLMLQISLSEIYS